MAHEIAKLFGTLGFNVDMSGIKRFENGINRIRGQLQGVANSTVKVKNSVERHTRGAVAGSKKQATAIASIVNRYDQYGGRLQKIREDYRRLNTLYKEGNISMERRGNLLHKLAYEYRQTQQAARDYAKYGSRDKGRPKKYGHRLNSLASGFVPGIGTAFAGMQSFQAYQKSLGMEQALTAASGSREQAMKDMDYLIEQAKRLGVYVGSVGRNFAQMAASAKGSKLEGQGVKELFESIAEQARIYNLSEADTEGLFRGFTQVLNKGTLMAEEVGYLAS